MQKSFVNSMEEVTSMKLVKAFLRAFQVCKAKSLLEETFVIRSQGKNADFSSRPVCKTTFKGLCSILALNYHFNKVRSSQTFLRTPLKICELNGDIFVAFVKPTNVGHVVATSFDDFCSIVSNSSYLF